MTLLVEKGVFSKTTSTSTPVSQQVNLSNGSLTPKLLILWTTGQTTNDGTYVDDARMSYGFSDGTNDACQAFRVDESAESESYTFRNDSVIAIISLTAGSIVSQADVSAFAAGSFTLNWSVQSDTTAQQIHYMVAGGTDITNVSVASVVVGNTATGNHSYTGSGTTFTPEFALIMNSARDYAAVNSLQVGGDFGIFAIGAAQSTSKRWVMWGRDETVGTSDCDMYINPSACISACTITTGAVNFEADFVSFDNAAGGGITVNINPGAGDNLQPLAFLLIKGGNWDCGTFQQRSGTGTQDVTLTTGLDPSLVFLGGINTANSATVTANNYIGIGGSDGTNEGCSYYGNTNGLGTFAAVHSNLNTKVYRISTPNATAASSTTNAECDMNDMATTGKFQLNWTQADTTLRQMAFWALGPAAAAGNNITRTITEPTITLSETTARLSAKTRARTEGATTLTESAARLSAKMRPLATETLTLTESVTRLKAKNVSKTVSDSTTLTESIARLDQKARAFSETLTLSETSARRSTKMRAVTEPAITLSESTAKVKSAIKTLTDSITLTESIARLAAKIRTASDTITITESIARLKAALRAASESIALSDNVTRTTQAGQQNITRTLSEALGVSDNVARLKSSLRAISEATTISETVSRLKAAQRTVSETTTLTESLARLKSAMRSVSEPVVTIADQTTRLLGKSRTLSEAITSITDAVDRTLGHVGQEVARSVSETIYIQDILDWIRPELIRIYDQVTITVQHNVSKALTDSLTLSDTIARLAAKQLTVLQDLTITEAASRMSQKTRAITEPVISIADSVARVVSAGGQEIVRTLTETMTLTESIARQTAKSRAVTQIVTIAETIARQTAKSRAVSDTVNVADSIARSVGHQIARTLSDSITIATDSLAIQRAKVRQIAETTGITEVLAYVITYLYPPPTGGGTIPYRRTEKTEGPFWQIRERRHALRARNRRNYLRETKDKFIKKTRKDRERPYKY